MSHHLTPMSHYIFHNGTLQRAVGHTWADVLGLLTVGTLVGIGLTLLVQNLQAAEVMATLTGLR